MSERDARGPEALSRLRSLYGQEISLVSETGEESFRLLAEFRLGEAAYAALQTPAMRKEDEIAFFRVVGDGDALELETIPGDDEWEDAAEGYDSLLFGGTDFD